MKRHNLEHSRDQSIGSQRTFFLPVVDAQRGAGELPSFSAMRRCDQRGWITGHRGIHLKKQLPLAYSMVPDLICCGRKSDRTTTYPFAPLWHRDC